MRGLRILMAGSGLASMVLAAGCSAQAPAPPAAGNQSAGGQNKAEAEPGAGIPEVRIASGEGGCAVSMEGRSVDADALGTALRRDLEARVAAFGPEAIDPELIGVRFVAAPDTPWRCVAGTIHHVRRIGYEKVALDVEEAQRGRLQQVQSPVHLDLPTSDGSAQPAGDRQRNKVVLRDDGSLLWNGTAVDAETLGDFARAARTIAPPPRLEVEIGGDARFADVLTNLALVRASGFSVGSPPVQPGETRELQTFNVEEPPPPEEEPPPPPDAGSTRVGPVVRPPAGPDFALVGLERFANEVR